MSSIKIKVNPDGSMKAEVIGCSDKEIADIKLQDGKLKMIERIINGVDDKGKPRTIRVIHKVWDINNYHEDVKYSTRKLLAKKIDENKKLEERWTLRAKIKKYIKDI